MTPLIFQFLANTPDKDFEDLADVWNDVSGSWWDITRDDSSNNVEIGAWYMGWHISTLAETTYIASNGVMYDAYIDFNSAKDFRDVNVSQGCGLMIMRLLQYMS